MLLYFKQLEGMLSREEGIPKHLQSLIDYLQEGEALLQSSDAAPSSEPQSAATFYAYKLQEHNVSCQSFAFWSDFALAY